MAELPVVLRALVHVRMTPEVETRRFILASLLSASLLLMGEELQADQALLLHPGLLGVSGRHVCRDEAFWRWSRRRVKGTGAAGRGVGGLIGGVIDEAVGSWLAATLHAEGELCLGHGVMEAIDVHAEGVGVCRGETRVTSCSDRNQHVQTCRSMAVKTKPERSTWCPPSPHNARNSQQIIARKEGVEGVETSVTQGQQQEGKKV